MSQLLRTVFLVDLLQGMWATFKNQKPSLAVTEQYPQERPAVAEITKIEAYSAKKNSAKRKPLNSV